MKEPIQSLAGIMMALALLGQPDVSNAWALTSIVKPDDPRVDGHGVRVSIEKSILVPGRFDVRIFVPNEFAARRLLSFRLVIGEHKEPLLDCDLEVKSGILLPKGKEWERLAEFTVAEHLLADCRLTAGYREHFSSRGWNYEFRLKDWHNKEAQP